MFDKPETANNGDLFVWWCPQVPMPNNFYVPIKDLAEGVKLIEVLAQYDLYQLKNNIKPDFCNTGGIVRWCTDYDGEGNPGFEDWYDHETGEDDPEEWLKSQQKQDVLCETSMKHITSNADLIPDRHYWCRDKHNGKVTLEKCGVHPTASDWKYLGTMNHIWAMDNNNQALERWDVVGPVPQPAVNFDDYLPK